MRESDLERKVVEYCHKRGLLTYKFVSPNNRGVPDRIVVCAPRGGIMFLELKRPGAKPTKLQFHEMERLRLGGCNVQWADNWELCLTILRDFCPP